MIVVAVVQKQLSTFFFLSLTRLGNPTLSKRGSRESFMEIPNPRTVTATLLLVLPLCPDPFRGLLLWGA